MTQDECQNAERNRFRALTKPLPKLRNDSEKRDLEKYLAVYTPAATEMRGPGPAGGVEAIEQTMKSGFWKTGRPLQTLRYESIVVRMLGKTSALVTGNYILTGGNIAERKGWFTSVWQKIKKGWRMIHDHS